MPLRHNAADGCSILRRRRYFCWIDLVPLALGQQHDHDHAPDRQQGIPDRVSDGVTEPRNLALGAIIDHAERGRRRPRARAASQHDGIVETEQVFAHVHRQDQGYGRDDDTPQEQTEAKRLQSGNKARSRRNTHHGDENVEADGVHEPDGGGGNPAEGRTHRPQPSEEKPGNQGAAGSGQRQRNAANLVDNGAEQTADGDCRTNERHIRHVGRPVRVTQQFGGGRDVLGTPDDGDNIAPVQFGVRQNWNVGGGRPARDLAQEDTARRRRFRQLGQSFAVGLFGSDVNIDALDRYRQQLAVVHFLRSLPDQVHQHVTPPGNGEDVACLDYDIGSGIHDLAAASYALNKDTLFRQERLGFLHGFAHGASVRGDPVGTQLELVPRRPWTAQGSFAPVLLLVTLAGGLEVDAE